MHHVVSLKVGGEHHCHMKPTSSYKLNTVTVLAHIMHLHVYYMSTVFIVTFARLQSSLNLKAAWKILLNEIRVW